VSLDEVLAKLKALAKPDQLEGMARYEMAIERRLGVSIPDLRKLAKTTSVKKLARAYKRSSLLRKSSNT
jgi:hypothetical protein